MGLELAGQGLPDNHVVGPMVGANLLEYTSVLALPLGLCGGACPSGQGKESSLMHTARLGPTSSHNSRSSNSNPGRLTFKPTPYLFPRNSPKRSRLESSRPDAVLITHYQSKPTSQKASSPSSSCSH
eukprot:1158083-Pelagomonas_calceolata.AAC.5